jgi:hypothetical protein
MLEGPEDVRKDDVQPIVEGPSRGRTERRPGNTRVGRPKREVIE